VDVYLPGRVFETVVELELRGVLLRLTDRGRWFCSLDRSSLVVRFGVAEDVGRCLCQGLNINYVWRMGVGPTRKRIGLREWTASETDAILTAPESACENVPEQYPICIETALVYVKNFHLRLLYVTDVPLLILIIPFNNAKENLETTDCNDSEYAYSIWIIITSLVV